MEASLSKMSFFIKSSRLIQRQGSSGVAMHYSTNKNLRDELNSGRFRLINRVRGRARAFCPKCERPVQLLSDAKAEEFFKSALSELLYLASRGVLHRLHNSRGILMFCGDSLFQCFNDRPTQLLTSPNAPNIYEFSNKKGLQPG